MANGEFKNDAKRLGWLVKRTRAMLEYGYSVADISKKLEVDESKVRSLVEICKKSDENKRKHEEMNK